MQQTTAIIEKIRYTSAQLQTLELLVSDEMFRHFKPGQSLLVRPLQTDGSPDMSSYLMQQWFPLGLSESGLLYIERPVTERYEPQAMLHLYGLIGRGFRFRASLRNILLIAVDTSPAVLLTMVSMLTRNRISITLVLLGSARAYATSHLPAEVEVIRGKWQPG